MSEHKVCYSYSGSTQWNSFSTDKAEQLMNSNAAQWEMHESLQYP